MRGFLISSVTGAYLSRSDLITGRRIVRLCIGVRSLNLELQKLAQNMQFFWRGLQFMSPPPRDKLQEMEWRN